MAFLHNFIWFPFSSAEGDLKVTVATRDLENASAKATVSLYVFGETRCSGPIILGSGKHQLFNPNSADKVKVKLIQLSYEDSLQYVFSKME